MLPRHRASSWRRWAEGSAEHWLHHGSLCGEQFGGPHQDGIFTHAGLRCRHYCCCLAAWAVKVMCDTSSATAGCSRRAQSPGIPPHHTSCI